MDKKTQYLLNKIIQNSNIDTHNFNEQSDLLFNDLYKLQQDILLDKTTYKVLFAGRRSGKTVLVIHKLIISCLTVPNSGALYISLSKSHAKDLIWFDLIDILNKYNIVHQHNSIDLTITFPNRSKITVSGVDCLRAAERYRGKRYNVVVIDEAAAFGEYVQYLINDVLKATLEDFEGSELWLASTPNAACAGFFYEVVKEKKYPKYKIWEWDYRQNPKLPRWNNKHNWKQLANERFEAMRKEFELEGKLNTFLREYENKWIKDKEALLFPNVQTVERIPDVQMFYYMGIDVGWVDDTAIVVCGVTQEPTPKVYIVDHYSNSEVPTQELAGLIKQYSDKYSPVSIAVDPGGGGKRLIEDVNYAYGLNLTSAEKPQKRKPIDIQLIDDLMREKRIYILSGLGELYDEVRLIQWKDKANGIIDSRFKDHSIDALVYAYRELVSYITQTSPPEPNIDTRNDLSIDHHKENMIKQISKQNRFERNLFGR
jgi:phage terminase large subunit